MPPQKKSTRSTVSSCALRRRYTQLKIPPFLSGGTYEWITCEDRWIFRLTTGDEEPTPNFKEYRWVQEGGQKVRQSRDRFPRATAYYHEISRFVRRRVSQFAAFYKDYRFYDQYGVEMSPLFSPRLYHIRVIRILWEARGFHTVSFKPPKGWTFGSRLPVVPHGAIEDDDKYYWGNPDPEPRNELHNPVYTDNDPCDEPEREYDSETGSPVYRDLDTGKRFWVSRVTGERFFSRPDDVTLGYELPPNSDVQPVPAPTGDIPPSSSMDAPQEPPEEIDASTAYESADEEIFFQAMNPL